CSAHTSLSFVTSTFLGGGAVPSYLTVPLIVPPAALARPAPTVMLSATPAHAASTTPNLFITIPSCEIADMFYLVRSNSLSLANNQLPTHSTKRQQPAAYSFRFSLFHWRRRHLHR